MVTGHQSDKIQIGLGGIPNPTKHRNKSIGGKQQLVAERICVEQQVEDHFQKNYAEELEKFKQHKYVDDCNEYNDGNYNEEDRGNQDGSDAGGQAFDMMQQKITDGQIMNAFVGESQQYMQSAEYDGLGSNDYGSPNPMVANMECDYPIEMLSDNFESTEKKNRNNQNDTQGNTPVPTLQRKRDQPGNQGDDCDTDSENEDIEKKLFMQDEDLDGGNYPKAHDANFVHTEENEQVFDDIDYTNNEKLYISHNNNTSEKLEKRYTTKQKSTRKSLETNTIFAQYNPDSQKQIPNFVENNAGPKQDIFDEDDNASFDPKNIPPKYNNQNDKPESSSVAENKTKQTFKKYFNDLQQKQVNVPGSTHSVAVFGVHKSLKKVGKK